MINFEKTMAKTLIKGLVYYHALIVDINRVLYIAGLRNDVKAEEVGKKHAMAVYDVLVRAYGQDKVDKILNQN